LAQFTVIAKLDDPAVARVLCVALKAHGFHPLEGGEEGLPGMPGIRNVGGKIEIRVPESEGRDATVLATALIADMKD